MKVKVILLCLTLPFLVSDIAAQRYLNPVFDTVDVTPDVIYGINNNYLGVADTLMMDIYTPRNDSAVTRPLLVLAHGGSFVGGSRKASDISKVCHEFARRGYVCVSIKYRLGVMIFGDLSREFSNAVWRGAQDGRAAIRFLRKSMANGNPYKLNDKLVYTGGISAGGVLGLHLAFLDVPEELVTYPLIDTVSYGGIEGNSGNPGYSWKVRGVINLCGAIGNVSWFSNNRSVSIFSVHGTNDQTVPYGSDFFKFSGFNIAFLQGSYSVDSAAKSFGMRSTFHTFYGAPHVPFSDTSATGRAFMDSTLKFLADFLYQDMSQPANGLRHYEADQRVLVYPVPAQNSVSIQFSKPIESLLTLHDISGQQILKLESNEANVEIKRNGIPPGIYFLSIQNSLGRVVREVVFE